MDVVMTSSPPSDVDFCEIIMTSLEGGAPPPPPPPPFQADGSFSPPEGVDEGSLSSDAAAAAAAAISISSSESRSSGVGIPKSVNPGWVVFRLFANGSANIPAVRRIASGTYFKEGFMMVVGGGIGW